MDTLKVLVTTDNHVGYAENDPVRGGDSGATFEEVMAIAAAQDVDFVLQLGDLFHVNKPLKKLLVLVMQSLRRHALGGRPCEMELVLDPLAAFAGGFGVNYEDPNLNVLIPVFAISGNHDDGSGDGHLSPLDVLGVSGLVNHFGMVRDNDAIQVDPVLLTKGSTRLALYGMASVRDERLFRTFRDKKVAFSRPSEDPDSWFSLMCVHQNHAAHTATSYLPEHFLPRFLDLVVWGHEHECIPHAVPNPDTGFSTLQPGSLVATLLCEGEAVDKHVFVLSITGKRFLLEPIRLQTVRPFVMRELALSLLGIPPGPALRQEIARTLTEEIDRLIAEGGEKWSEANPGSVAEPPLPLVRLRVEYSGGYEVENPRRFLNRFVGRVANINDVVQFHKKQKGREVVAGKTVERATNYDANVHVQDLVNQFLPQGELSLLTREDLNSAVKRFVDSEDKSGLVQLIEQQVESGVGRLGGGSAEVEMAMEAVEVKRENKRGARTGRKAKKASPSPSPSPSPTPSSPSYASSD